MAIATNIPMLLKIGFVVQGHKSPDSFQKHERAERQRSTEVFCRDRMKDKCAGMSLGRSVHSLPGRCSNLTNKSSGIGIGEGRWEGQEWWGRSFHQSHTQINESGNREQRQRRCKDSEERDRRWRWNEKRKQDRNLSVNIWVFLGSLTWFEECSVKSLFYSGFSPGWKGERFCKQHQNTKRFFTNGFQASPHWLIMIKIILEEETTAPLYQLDLYQRGVARRDSGSQSDQQKFKEIRDSDESFHLLCIYMTFMTFS